MPTPPDLPPDALPAHVPRGVSVRRLTVAVTDAHHTPALCAAAARAGFRNALLAVPGVTPGATAGATVAVLTVDEHAVAQARLDLAWRAVTGQLPPAHARGEG